MPDLLRKLHHHPATAWLARAASLPDPVELRRAAGPSGAQELAGRRAVIGGAAGGYAVAALTAAVTMAGAAVDSAASSIDILIFDATGCRTPGDYAALYEAFHPAAPRVAPNGRVLLVAAPPEATTDPIAAAAARGIEGFSRSLGKELGKKGITVNLVYAAAEALDRLDGVVRFFCGPRSTYVSGQSVRLSTAAVPMAAAAERLQGKVAVVTGSARGIGMACAQRLAEEGATVVCVDVPAASQALHDTCRALGATALVLDIAGPEAPARLLDFLRERFGGVDIVVHNAGITRDRTLARMARADWDLVVDVNFRAIAAIDEALLAARLQRDGGRTICLSSISGIAGNFGQSNYAATKAALVGYVAARAAQLGNRGITVNAVAPGFIETPMTQRMPFVPRELGRRLNSLKQGGQPRDVAELVAFLASPASVGVTGNTIRVCGQALIGA
ncbi:3-oxoacyl-ACP reductase [Pseudoduganella chitinolytica]|uniref:3-oxoacyl-ACP reductase n=1 Tax=Pseudoduganella chitinolytica TaxID=34070 RepID=A0ABY8B6R7_9BURK|nr:3-oxoacyl-ACP reductase [Pseudoduganella chitinolytica]WEF30696.1 3-oxoacyl-ACP reductase [Pseudoduganella chitinolytica]